MALLMLAGAGGSSGGSSGGGSSALPGSNAERVSTLLAGRTPHFSYSASVPDDPVTTREVTVSTAAEFNTEAAVAGTKITIGASFSGAISFVADDVDVVMSNALTVTGNVTFGQGDSVRPQRLRWTGGNINGGLHCLWMQNVMFDDVYLTSPDNWNNEFAAFGQAPINVSFLNSTIYVPVGVAGDYPIISTPSVGVPSGMILGNFMARGNASSLHLLRFMFQDNFIMFDSVSNPDGLATGGALRLHAGCDNVWVRDTDLIGAFHCNGTGSYPTGPDITNGLLDNVTRYARDSNLGVFAYDTAPSFTGNEGTVQNCTLYNTSGSGTVGVNGMSDGGGNTNQIWDEVTLPDYSAIGAQR